MSPVPTSDPFVLGVALGSLVVRGWRLRLPLGAAIALAAVALVAAMWAPMLLSRYAVTLIPFALLVIALACSDLSGRRTLLTTKPIVALGNWSYSFYLLHAMALSVSFDLFGRALPGHAFTAVAVGLALSVVGSWALHRYVELPANRFLRQKIRAP